MAKFNDYWEDLKAVRLMTVVVCVLSSMVTIYMIKSSFDEADMTRNEIFVADAENTLLLALSSDMSSNRSNEAKAVVNKMHTHLFYMSPTATSIEAGINNATGLGDESVLQYANKKMEQGWYNMMMAEGVSTEFVSDSISTLDSDKEGYDFLVRLYGKTSTIYSTHIEFRRIVTSCYVMEQKRTIENPSGYKCCFFKVEKEETIQTFRRKDKLFNTNTEETGNE